MKRIIVILLLLVFVLAAAPVISWIPPYAVDQAVTKLKEPKVLDGLSHIALQFWVPSGTSVVKGKYEAEGQFNDDKIREIRDIARAKNVKALLCVYNGENGWVWSLATTAMSSPEVFSQSLIDEMNRLDLDGIEIDLEGPNVGGDGAVFINFIKVLSAKLKPLGKDLTLASFHSEYHTPGPRHWEQLLPYVDGITTMGYAEIGANATTSVDPSIFQPKYAQQKALASSAPEKLMIGMPSYMDSWQGNSAQEQVDWVKNDGVVGLAMWDLQLQNSAWNTDAIWDAIAEIRGPLNTTYKTEASAGVGGKIEPAGSVDIDSAGSKTFTFTPSEWFVVDDVIVDGQSKGARDSYTFDNVTEEHTIKVTFKKDPNAPELFVISAKANANGSISPENSRTVAKGGDLAIAITPDAGYVVDYVIIDGTDRGPIVSIDFSNLSRDHSVEVYFKKAVGGDLGQYEAWYSGIKPAYLQVVHHNDSLWSYTGDQYGGSWGASMEPTIALKNQYGVPPWTYEGLYSGIPDTLITAELQYKSADDASDTLEVKTTYVSQGAVYKTDNETIILPSNGTAAEKTAVKKNGALLISRAGLAFLPSAAGEYKVNLYDLRGRELFVTSVLAKANHTVGTGINTGSFSRGVYIMKIEGAGLTAVQRLQF